MTNVNGHAALPVLAVCPPAGRADLGKRDLRRRARQVRQEAAAERKRRPEPATPAMPESKPEPAPGKPPKAHQKAVTGPPKPTPPDNPEQAAARGKGKPGREPQPAAVGGTKKQTVLALLRRPQGATLAELVQATGWQSHSVRGFLSGALRHRMGLKVRSSKRDGVRVYSLRGLAATTPR